MRTSLAALLALVALTSACAKTPDLDAVAASDATTAAPTSSSVTTPSDAVDATVASTTTVVAETTTSEDAGATSTTSSTTSTSIVVDDAAPTPPTGLACTSTGATDVTISWDAPIPEEEVASYKLYVDVGDGPFVQRGTLTVDEAADASGDPESHAAVVSPVPVATPVQIAVTAFDGSGNESGWNPLDVWYLGAGSTCNSGSPPAVTNPLITRGAGSSEVNMTFLSPAQDVESYEASVSQAGGAPSVVLVQPAGQSVAVVIGGIDYDAPFTIGVSAIDHHGNSSAEASFDCDSLPSGGSC